MVIRVSSVYPVDIQKHDHRQTKDGVKKKEPLQFKEVLAQALQGTTENAIGYKR